VGKYVYDEVTRVRASWHVIGDFFHGGLAAGTGELVPPALWASAG